MTNRAFDLVVVGAGPAGRGLAHRAAISGLQVALVDPRAESPWRPTYAAWADDLPAWLDRSVIGATCASIAVHTPGRRVLHRPYVTLRTVALQNSLTLDGVTVMRRATTVVSADSVQLDDGTIVAARAVVDARGLRVPGGPSQTAFGVVVDRAVAAPILGDDSGILMDWRDVQPDRTPSFLYAIPLDDNRILLEETCLAATPGLPVRGLKTRLGERLARFDIDVTSLDVSATEAVDFALRERTRLPWASTGPLRFGAAGGMIHPATGYSVAESLSSVDGLVAAASVGADLTGALWPRQSRMVHRLRLRGLEVLLGLSPTDVAAFFDAFFQGPDRAQRAYLSDRHHLGGTLAAMAATVAHTDIRLGGNIIRAATQ